MCIPQTWGSFLKSELHNAASEEEGPIGTSPPPSPFLRPPERGAPQHDFYAPHHDCDALQHDCGASQHDCDAHSTYPCRMNMYAVVRFGRIFWKKNHCTYPCQLTCVQLCVCGGSSGRRITAPTHA